MNEKWHVRTKGYLKIHVAVNVKTKKKILSVKVTDEHAHDYSKALPELVDEIIESDNITAIGKLFADGGAYYDTNGIFRCLAVDTVIFLPCIKVRKNAKVRWKKGNILINLSVISQKNDLQKWKDSIVSYGQRWITETVFSCLKRRFGEYVYSVRLKNMIQQKMMLKASLYNKLISV